SLKLWGIPAAHEHDAERGMVCEEFTVENQVECEGGGEEAKIPAEPFLGNPTTCETVFGESMEASSWEEPFAPASNANSEVGPFVECERVHFDPGLQADPTTSSAESSSGLNVALEVAQTWENPATIATSNLRDATVALPVGYTINPSAGNGLAGCTPQQYAAETAFSSSSEGCPPESKLGSVTIETPILAERIEGSVYLAEPLENPFGSLIALYVVAKAPDRGVIVKSSGRVDLDPVTGQITSTFSNLPQQPFSKVTLKLKQGTTSPLVSPQACGTYNSQASLTPSSAPTEPRTVTNALRIENGIGDGPCPAGGIPPFKPTV